MSNPIERSPCAQRQCTAVVIWIDWYAYHVARFMGLQSAFGHSGEVVGIELVGGIGVHAGIKFREDLPPDLPIETLMPEKNWRDVNKFRVACTLWRRLSELDPEIVLVPGYYSLPAIAAALWARRNDRISVLMTESAERDHVRSVWKEKLKSILIRRLFSWAVTGGAAHVRYLRQLGFRADRIAHFYDVVGNERLREHTTTLRTISAPADHHLPSSYFLYVGRLAPEKNVEALLAAWLTYRQQGGLKSLVIVGDGPNAQSLRKTAADSSFAQHAVFAGHKSSRELLPFFAFADCFVLPSTREPWGLVVNEAMAASLPLLVSSSCGCAEDLVDVGGNGYVFDPNNIDEISGYLHLFDRIKPKALSLMRETSASRISVFSPRNFGAEISDIRAMASPRKAAKPTVQSPGFPRLRPLKIERTDSSKTPPSERAYE